MAVQLKMWEGEVDLGHPIQQIRDAYLNYQGITSAAILTTLDAVAKPSQRAVEDLSLGLAIPIKVLTKDEVLELFLRHLSDITVASE